MLGTGRSNVPPRPGLLKPSPSTTNGEETTPKRNVKTRRSNLEMAKALLDDDDDEPSSSELMLAIWPNKQGSNITRNTAAFSKSSSRELLKHAVQQRRESLSLVESQVLDELCEHGSERETELAHQTLLSYRNSTSVVVPNEVSPIALSEGNHGGSTRRQLMLNARKQQSSQLWLAHESRRSLTTTSPSTTTTTTTPSSKRPKTTPRELLGMVFRAKRTFHRWTGNNNNAKRQTSSQLRRQSAISAGGRINDVSSSSPSSSANFAMKNHDASLTAILSLNHHHVNSKEIGHLMSSQRPNFLLARNASVNNYYRGEGFEIDVSLSSSPSISASSSSTTSDKDELRDCFDSKRDLSIRQQQQQREDVVPTFRRPVLMKRASIISGEGMEVADWGSEWQAHHQQTIAAAVIPEALLLEQRSISFDETMSYERIQEKFAHGIRRSLSDSNLSVHTQQKTADETFLNEIADFHVYDSWLVPPSSHRFGFSILGTSANDTECHPHVLSPPMMERLQLAFPTHRQGENWWLRYSLVRDGASIHCFLDHVKGAQCSLLAIETVDGEVFGCFTSDAWHREPESFGIGPSFLWRYRHNRHHKTWSVLDQATMEEELDVYPLATGCHGEVQLCTATTLGIGGLRETFTPGRTLANGTFVHKDEWGFGLRMTGDVMLEGTSAPCYPFQSPSLSRVHADGSNFEIVNIELWTMTPCLDAMEAERLELKHLFLREHMRPL